MVLSRYSKELEKELNLLLKNFVQKKIRYKTVEKEINALKKEIRKKATSKRGDLKLINRYMLIFASLKKKKIKTKSTLKLPINYNYKGRKYVIQKSSRKDKQLMAVDVKTGKKVHFGDPSMREWPGTKREDRFCTRTFGIKNKKGKPTRDNPNYANFWNRRITWICQGKIGANKKRKQSL